MQAKKNLLAAVTLGRDVVRSAALAVADNPPSLSAILLSAALAVVLERIHARAAWINALPLE